MTLFDLVLILAVLGCLIALFALCYFLLCRQWIRARRVLLALGIFLVLYVAVLLSVSLLSPQRVLAMHQNRCFDDWCLSVEKAVQQPAIGTMPTTATAHGTFYLVTVHISSQARAITQRAVDVQLALLDTQGQYYNPDAAGQRVLDETGQSGQPLDSKLTPGGSFTHTVVFDLPKGDPAPSLVVTHGLFPEVMVIGSEQSFLHKPTIIRLQFP